MNKSGIIVIRFDYIVIMPMLNGVISKVYIHKLIISQVTRSQVSANEFCELK